MVLYTELLPHHLLIAAVGDKVLTAETGAFTLCEKRGLKLIMLSIIDLHLNLMRKKFWK